MKGKLIFLTLALVILTLFWRHPTWLHTALVTIACIAIFSLVACILAVAAICFIVSPLGKQVNNMVIALTGGSADEMDFDDGAQSLQPYNRWDPFQVLNAANERAATSHVFHQEYGGALAPKCPEVSYPAPAEDLIEAASMFEVDAVLKAVQAATERDG